MPLDDISLEELQENFQLFDDWESRYSYIIDLGKKLDSLDDTYKTDAFRVRGCISQVWMTYDVVENGEPKIVFHADSDAAIVRGLIAILFIIYSNRTATEILKTDLQTAFQQFDLAQHISPNRRNGFASMIERIKAIAAQVAERG